MKAFINTLLLSITISGCSVGMAMSGKEEPNLGMVQVGASREADGQKFKSIVQQDKSTGNAKETLTPKRKNK